VRGVAAGLHPRVSAERGAEMVMCEGSLQGRQDERRARRLARLSVILRSFEPLPVDAAVAASYGELAAATHRAGRNATARSLDLMIAATAHAHGARLVTSNVDDVLHLDTLIEIVQA